YRKLLLESDKATQTLQQNGTGWYRAINRAKKLSQKNDRIQHKLTEQQGEIKHLHELIKITRPEINFDDEAY
ncbi:9540_t:CDS:1, partial [Racocetra persica]